MIPRRSIPLLLGAILIGAASLVAAPPVIPPLVDPPTHKLVPGRFVWGDLFSTDPSGSTQFYTQLFGWTARSVATDEGKSYTILTQGGNPVAGVVQGPATPDGKAAARWIGYISVKDVAKAMKAVSAKRGRVIIGPRMVPDRGMHAIVADSEGALFGLMNSTAGDPPDYLPSAGRWMWISLFAHEPRDVIPLYRAVAGWQEFEDYRTENLDDYLMSTGGYARAGISKLQPQSKAPSMWVGFVRVDHVRETVARAVSLGARTIVEPRAITAGNEIAILSDPLGAVIGLSAFLEDSGAQK